MAAWRARKAAEAEVLEAVVRGSWFEPELTDAEFQAYAAENGWDYVTTKERKESFERASRLGSINLNRYTLSHCVNDAVNARLLFHEAWLIHQDIHKALEAARTLQITFAGNTDVERELNRQARYAAARERWYEGKEILFALTGKKEQCTDAEQQTKNGV